MRSYKKPLSKDDVINAQKLRMALEIVVSQQEMARLCSLLPHRHRPVASTYETEKMAWVMANKKRQMNGERQVPSPPYLRSEAAWERHLMYQPLFRKEKK